MCFIESVSWAEILMPCFCPRSSETEATSLSIISSFVRSWSFGYTVRDSSPACPQSCVIERRLRHLQRGKVQPLGTTLIEAGTFLSKNLARDSAIRGVQQDVVICVVVICVFGDAGKVCVDRAQSLGVGMRLVCGHFYRSTAGLVMTEKITAEIAAACPARIHANSQAKLRLSVNAFTFSSPRMSPATWCSLLDNPSTSNLRGESVFSATTIRAGVETASISLRGV